MNKFRKALIFAIGIVLVSIVIFIFSLTNAGYLHDDGYIVTGNEVYSILNSGPDAKEEKAAALFPVSYEDKLYKRVGALLVDGDKGRTQINTVFPMFINNGSVIMCFDDQMSLVTNEFTRLTSYKNLYISEGISFNVDGQRADPDTFIFAELKNGLFLNTKNITINSVYGKTVIPANSVISFTSDSMYFGVFDSGSLIIDQLEVLYRATVIVDEKEYDYLELLRLLGKLKDEEPIITANLDVPQIEEPLAEVLPDEVIAPDYETKPDNIPQLSELNELTKNAEGVEIPLDFEETDETAQQNDLLQQKEPNIPEKPEEPIRPETTEPPGTPKTPEPPTATQTPIDGTSNSDDSQVDDSDSTESGDSTIVEVKPIKPPKPAKTSTVEVVCTDFTPWVYTLNGDLKIKDPMNLIYKGVRFNIYKEGKMYLRLSFTSSGDISLGTLPPDTEFEVEGVYQYENPSGAREEKIFFAKKNYKTLPIEGNIDPIDISYDNTDAEIYPAQIEIDKLSFNLNPDSTVKNNALPYINRMDVNIKEQDSNNSWDQMVSPTILKALKTAKTIEWVSSSVLNSNKAINFEMTIKDRFGNLLPFKDDENAKGSSTTCKGSTLTCKQPPQAAISIVKNEIGKLTLKVEITNPDHIDIDGDIAYLTILDIHKQPVTISGSYDTNLTFSMQRIPLNTTVTTLTIDNLPVGVSLTAEVTASFDIENNKGLQYDQLIGKMSFYTVPISSLGFANYTVEISDITSSSAKIAATMNSSTSPKLLPLLTRIKLVVGFGDTEIFDFSLKKEELSELDISDVDANGEIVLAEADVATGKPKIVLKAGDVSYFGVNAWNALLSGANPVTAEKKPATIVVTYPKDTLTSATSYTVTIKTYAEQGDVENDVTSPSARYNFQTLKDEPFVTISNYFVTEKFVEFYNLKVIDEDAAIIGSTVSARLYMVNADDTRGSFVSAQTIKAGTEYTTLKFSDLQPETKYELIFLADAYNSGFNNATYQINYELQTKFSFSTINAVVGNITLEGLNYAHQSGENVEELFDNTTVTKSYYLNTANAAIANTSYWYSDYIVVDPSKYYIKDSGTANNSYILFYRADKSFISSKSILGIVKPADFPAGTAYIRFNAYILDRWCATPSFREYNPELLGAELFDKTKVTPNYMYNSNVALTSYSGYGVSHYIEVSPGAEYLRSGTSMTWLTFFDVNKKVVALIQANPSAPVLIRAPEKARYARIDYLTSTGLANSSFKQYGSTPQNNAYTAKLLAQITDANNELVGREYIVRGYKASISGNPDYQPFGSDYVEDITADANGITQDIEAYIQKTVDANSAYKFELIIKMSSTREVLLSEVAFTTQGPITTLRNNYDLMKIMRNPYGRFIVIDDTTYPGLAVMWNTSVPFMGELDFQGNSYTTNSNYLLASIGKTGELKNLVLNLNRNYTGYGTDIFSLVNQNYGKISNIYMNYNTTHEMDYNSGMWAGLGVIYQNMSSGTLQNFVINLQKDLVIGYLSAGAIRQNYGTVQNGYICSYNGSMIKSLRDYYHTNKNYISGIVARNSPSGRVLNVYGLIDIENYKETATDTTHATTGILIGYNLGTISGGFVTGDRRVYEPEISVGLEATLNVTQSAAYGPAVGVTEGKYASRNVYYTSNNIAYINPYQTKVGLPAFWDPGWYKTVIDSQGQFLVDQSLALGYFPLVKMPSYMMANQQYIELPELTPAIAPKIVATTLTKQTETYALADITFDNPQLLRIKSMVVHNLTCEIISQELESNNVYRVKVRLSTPASFLSKYEISSITYSSYGANHTVNYGTTQSGRYYVNAEFYKGIYSVNDWHNYINGDLTQNYRLKADLDFSFYTYDYMVIGGTQYVFSGKLDGGIYDEDGNRTGIHKISNLIGGKYNYILYNLKGTLSNMLIDGFNAADTKATGQAYVGFVRYANTGASIDNVHLNNAKFTGYTYVGGIVGYANSTSIDNCSVRNSEFTSFANNISTLYLGGIVGDSYASSISNCYVNNLSFDARDLFQTEGVGGIVGRIRDANITNCYAYGRITSNGVYSGGIAGQVVNNTEVTGCFAYVDIIGTGDYVGGIAGRYYMNGESYSLDPYVQNNLAIGSVYTRSSASIYFHRIGGTSVIDVDGNVSERQRYNYAYVGQLVNGVIPSPEKKDDAYALLNYNDLTSPQSYTDIIGFDTSYDYSNIESGILPFLYSTQGSLLPYQTEIRLPIDTSAPIVIEEARETSNGIYYVQFKVFHTNTIVKSIAIDGLDITSQTPESMEGGTRYACYTTAVAPFDSYLLTVILEDVEGKETILQSKVDFGQLIFKNIANINDWQDFFSPTGQNMANTYANVNITGDIDFTGVVNPVTNVKVNRMTGQVVGGINPKIKNLTYTSNKLTGALINDIVTTCNNIDFENINWTYLNGTNTSSRVGLIGTSRKSLQDVNFNNIKMDAARATYLGMVGLAIGTVNNITLNHIQVNSVVAPLSCSQIGGLIGQLASGTMSNITATDITIRGQTYIGGLVGINYGTINNAILTNAVVIGTTYVGGMQGFCYYTNNCIIRNSTITATGNYVGGMNGYARLTSQNNLAEDIVVTASTSSYVGGIEGLAYRTLTDTARRITVTGKDYVGGVIGYGGVAGQNQTFSGNIAEECTVVGQNMVGGVMGSADYITNSNYAINTEVTGNNKVGGVMGANMNIASSYNEGAINCTVKGIAGNTYYGDHVGGLYGYVATKIIANSYVLNTTVEGRNNVGGLFGNVATCNAYSNHSNATVKSTGVNAGGIAGYVTSSAATGNIFTKIYNSYFAGTVEATNYAGGVIGLFEKGVVPTLSDYISPEVMLEANYYNLLNLGNVTIFPGSYISAWANKSGGSDPGTIGNFRLYNGVTLSEAGIASQVTDGDLPINATNVGKLLTSIELATPATYTATAPTGLGWTNTNQWSTGGTILLDVYDVFVSAGTGTASVTNTAWLRMNGLEDGNYSIIITKVSGPGTFTTQTLSGIAFSSGVAQINIPALVAGTYTLKFEVNGVTGKLINYVVKASASVVDMTLVTGGSGRYFTEPVTASVTPVGTGTFTYQWYKANGTGSGDALVTGATAASVQIAGRGYYYCRVTKGSYTSDSPLLFMDTDSYMPYVKNYASAYAVLPYQEGFKADGTAYVVTDGWYEGGIKIPGNAFRPMEAIMMFGFFPDEMSGSLPLPVPVMYASGADTINIEFGDDIPLNDKNYEPTSAFIVAANGIDIITQAIENRVYTINYDYETPLTITLINGSQSQSYHIEPDDVKRTVMTWGKDYFYTNDIGIGSSKGQILGSFVHMYNGYAMAEGGILYDLSDASIVQESTNIVLVETKPLYEFSYEDYSIDTYSRFTESSGVSGSIIREMQILIKNSTAYTLSPAEPVIYDGILIDSYLENELFALLGENKKIAKVSGDIRYPDDFRNVNIVHMSNTIMSDSHYVLVRYENGTVYGFDYLTGDKLDLSEVSSDMSLVEFMGDFVTSLISDFFPTFSEEYIQVKSLQEELTITPLDLDDYHPGRSEDKDKVIGDKTGVTGEKTAGGILELDQTDEVGLIKDSALTDVTGDELSVEDGTTDVLSEEDGVDGEEGSLVGGEGAEGGLGNEIAKGGIIEEGDNNNVLENPNENVEPNSASEQKPSGENATVDKSATSSGSLQSDPGKVGTGTTGSTATTATTGTTTTTGSSSLQPKQSHYVIAYNPKTMAYEVYNVNELLEPTLKVPASENEKLEKLNDTKIKIGLGVATKSTNVQFDAYMIFIVIAVVVAILLFFALSKIKPNKKRG